MAPKRDLPGPTSLRRVAKLIRGMPLPLLWSGLDDPTELAFSPDQFPGSRPETAQTTLGLHKPRPANALSHNVAKEAL